MPDPFNKLFKYCLIIVGFMFVGLGIIGAFLPGLPTVPLMIVALACFANSSERFHSWLYNHPMFGQQLQLWKKYNVIPPLAKIVALLSMLASSIYLFFFSVVSLLVIVPSIMLMACGALYILTKPSYPPS